MTDAQAHDRAGRMRRVGTHIPRTVAAEALALVAIDESRWQIGVIRVDPIVRAKAV